MQSLAARRILMHFKIKKNKFRSITYTDVTVFFVLKNCFLQTPKFCGNMRKFCYHGNRGRLVSRLNDIITLPDPKNPHFGTRIWNISAIQAEL